MKALHGNLASFLRQQIKEHGLSYREIQRRSRGFLSHSTVADILNERSGDIKLSTITGLAIALQVPEEEILRVATGRVQMANEDPRELNLLIYFRNLPAERQADLLRIARMFNREHGKRPAEIVDAVSKRKNRAA